MAVAAHHGCHVCVVMHTAALERTGAVTASVGGLRAFTPAVIASAGAVDDTRPAGLPGPRVHRTERA